jgi:hypothetical protein
LAPKFTSIWTLVLLQGTCTPLVHAHAGRTQRQRGGYGTKLLDTIAAELPAGSLERVPPGRGRFAGTVDLDARLWA